MVLNVSNAHICSQTPWTQWLLCQSIHVRVFADGQNIMMNYACINSSAKACQFALSVTRQTNTTKNILIINYIICSFNFYSSCLPDMLLLYCNRTWNECRQIQILQEIQMVKNINTLTGAPTLSDSWLESDLSSQVSRTNGWDRLRRLSGFFKARMTRSPHWLA